MGRWMMIVLLGGAAACSGSDKDVVESTDPPEVSDDTEEAEETDEIEGTDGVTAADFEGDWIVDRLIFDGITSHGVPWNGGGAINGTPVTYNASVTIASGGAATMVTSYRSVEDGTVVLEETATGTWTFSEQSIAMSLVGSAYLFAETVCTLDGSVMSCFSAAEGDTMELSRAD